MYYDSSSNLSSCTSVSYKSRLILLPSWGFTHTDIFPVFFFFLTSNKATIVAVSSSLSIFKWNLLDLFEHLYRFHWILKKQSIILKMIKKWSCKLISFNLKNEKCHLKNGKKWSCIRLYADDNTSFMVRDNITNVINFLIRNRRKPCKLVFE